MSLAQVLAGLGAAVEDGAVAGGADDVMLQGALTPLALGPQGSELALQGIDCAHRPQVRLAFLRGAGMHDVWQACKDDDRPGLHDPKDAKPRSAPYSSLPAIAHCRHEPGAGKKAAALQGPAPCWAGTLPATGWYPRLDPATMCVPQLTLCWQCSHRVASPAASGDLQDMHISRTLANFMMPPMARLGVLMVMLRVWSPAPHKTSTQDAELAVPLVLPPPCSACTEAKVAAACNCNLHSTGHRLCLCHPSSNHNLFSSPGIVWQDTHQVLQLQTSHRPAHHAADPWGCA